VVPVVVRAKGFMILLLTNSAAEAAAEKLIPEVSELYLAFLEKTSKMSLPIVFDRHPELAELGSALGARGDFAWPS
jgi:hypothetical protein